MNHKELVNKLANDPRHIDICNLAKEIVEEVSRINAKEVVFGKYIRPDIKEALDEFKQKAGEKGFILPESDTDLYNIVIKPIISLKVRRSL